MTADETNANAAQDGGTGENPAQQEQAGQPNATQQANQHQYPDAEAKTLADRLEAFRSNLIHDDAELEAQSFGTLLEMIQARRLPFHGGQADALELLKATRTEEARRAEDGNLPGSREVAGRAEPFQAPEAQPDTNATAAAVAEDIVAGSEVAKPEAPQPAAGENAGKVWNVHQQAWV